MIFKLILFQWLGPSIRNFTTEFRRKLDLEFWFGSKSLKSLLFTPKFPMKVKFLKFQIECVLIELANKKNINHFEFRKIEGFTGVLNNRVFWKKYQRFWKLDFSPFLNELTCFCDHLMKVYMSFFFQMFIRDSNFQTFQRTSGLKPDIIFYFITSSEFNVYQMRIKLVFFYSEKISYFFTSDWYDLYFHCSKTRLSWQFWDWHFLSKGFK